MRKSWPSVLARFALATSFAVVGALTARPAIAADVNGIIAGTYMLYENGVSNCSAQAIEDVTGRTVLLTANHCISSKDLDHSIHLIEFDRDDFDKKVRETVLYFDVVKTDPDTDLAVLRPVDKQAEITTVERATAEEAEAALKKGAQILIAGFPASSYSPQGELVFTDGYYTGLAKSFIDSVKADMCRTSGSVYYGNSGGGLYAEIDGEWKLVGVASQTDPELRWSNSLFVCAASIEKTLRFIAPRPATDH